MPQNVSVGIIRPISKMEGFSDTDFVYLEKVLRDNILKMNSEDYTFSFDGLVSSNESVSFIGRNIVTNIFASDIVVTILSGLNPNVMFETGLRLSQQKPTILISDSDTKVPFDLNSFEYLTYPKNLNAPEMEQFIRSFEEKFIGTWKQFVQDAGASTFIAGYSNSVSIDPNIDSLSLSQAIDKLSYMMSVMKEKYVSLDTSDVWDSYNFDHDIAISHNNADNPPSAKK